MRRKKRHSRLSIDQALALLSALPSKIRFWNLFERLRRHLGQNAFLVDLFPSLLVDDEPALEELIPSAPKHQPEEWSERFVDHFIPVLAYVRALERSPSGTPEEVSERLSTLVSEAVMHSVVARVPHERFQDGLFPVVAWVDERISKLKCWDGAHVWQAFLLQTQHFGTTLAGVEFYDRLDAIHDDPELTEIYLLCFAMGFQGKYNTVQQIPDLEKIRSEQFQRILKSERYDPWNQKLLMFPQAYQGQTEELPTEIPLWKRWLTPKTIMIAVIPPLTFFAIVFLLNEQLTHAIDVFKESIDL